jgi:L-arabinose isomerase
MSTTKEAKSTNPTIWQNLDFKKVKQRLNRITDQLEQALSQSSPIEAIDLLDSEDQIKLKEFMEANNLTESQAIAVIVHAFFDRKQH